MKASVLTLGCKANQAESATIEANLFSKGFEIVGLTEMPDICIINTCTVTSKSDYQSRQLIRRANRAGARVFVTGCYSELNKDAVYSMDGVEDIIENSNKYRIISMITGFPVDITLSYEHISKSRLFVKVQDGCNYSCSYCTIPKARGKSKSIEVGTVIDHIDKASGIYNEVVLTGIHLGTYGYDLHPKTKLSYLVKTILNKTKIKRIRLSSLEINEIDEAFLELLYDVRVCNHLHIPLQSGNDRVLRLMRRNYTSGTFIKGIENIIKKHPEISIGSDIIAGFPTETDEEFRNTYNLLHSMPFSYLHVFPFSKRPGTLASTMAPDIDHSTKDMRVGAVIALGKRKKTDYMKQQIGQTLDSLIEEVDGDGTCTGITRNYLRVRAVVKSPEVKSVACVRIDGYTDEALLGHQ
ncbi:MAG: tRNA (N(6)-L-threonylcarbamoyladenosine(37)-C(2))-methylthiotransferase MtaB [Nitrospirota bacterium]